MGPVSCQSQIFLGNILPGRGRNLPKQVISGHPAPKAPNCLRRVPTGTLHLPPNWSPYPGRPPTPQIGSASPFISNRWALRTTPPPNEATDGVGGANVGPHTCRPAAGPPPAGGRSASAAPTTGCTRCRRTAWRGAAPCPARAPARGPAPPPRRTLWQRSAGVGGPSVGGGDVAQTWGPVLPPLVPENTQPAPKPTRIGLEVFSAKFFEVKPKPQKKA